MTDTYQYLAKKALDLGALDARLIDQTTDLQKGQDVTLAIEKEAMLTGKSPFAFAMVLCVGILCWQVMEAETG
jgi:hypothetical protein